MSYNNNTSEQYARSRLQDSPLGRLGLDKPAFKYKSPLEDIKPDNYKYIQNALVTLVMSAQVREKDHTIQKLIKICDIIDQEVQSIRAIGTSYLEEIKNGTSGT